ncbi:Ubiquitin Carboxyl-Terminal Hydrolase Mindy-3 [Manis pentadactyla]|nr:Ubiquitin Carboxyl-Terminal Hydrolase Mindy-3 [Manis pentadactyla]
MMIHSYRNLQFCSFLQCRTFCRWVVTFVFTNSTPFEDGKTMMPSDHQVNLLKSFLSRSVRASWHQVPTAAELLCRATWPRRVAVVLWSVSPRRPDAPKDQGPYATLIVSPAFTIPDVNRGLEHKADLNVLEKMRGGVKRQHVTYGVEVAPDHLMSEGRQGFRE